MCTEWLWGRDEKGYGLMWFEGTTRRVHRVAYCLANGLSLSDIKGLVVRHKCDNPGCCNPDHLEEGSQKENVEDMFLRGRDNRPMGEVHHKAKLSETQAKEILGKFTGAFGEITRLAKEYGVDRTTVSKLLSGKNWRKTLRG